MARYVTGFELEQAFLDKDTAAPLAGGYIAFWRDADRTVPKLVYQQEEIGTDPNTGNPIYIYVALPNPVQLSAIGTIQNSTGDNIALFADIEDAEGVQELYFVQVFNYAGELQFTREGWPGGTFGGTLAANAGGGGNQISNPQFARVLFDTDNGLVITTSGVGTTTVALSPDWDIEVTATGAGSVTVSQVAVAGNSQIPTNPPYYLEVSPTASNISGILLRQRLINNPGIWTPTEQGINGWIATNILLGPSQGTVTIEYDPSSGTTQQLLSENNATPNFVEVSASVQLEPSDNAQTATVGYVDIVVRLPNTTVSRISSIQVLATNEEVTGVLYEQESVNRQVDQMFNYYQAGLDFKPVKSYLVGWDFPLNPRQMLGSTVAASAIGANKSKYVWDQTIVFQSADSGVGVTRDASGAIVLTAAATTQMALIQYLPQDTARSVLREKLSCMVSAYASVSVNATVELYYTTDVSLPSAWTSNNSLVLTLGTNGRAATFNGNWTAVPRGGLGDARISIGTSGDSSFNNYPLSGWDLDDPSVANTATYFAIVLGTASVASTNTITIKSISLVPGTVATIPAPQTESEVILDSQKYFWSTFPIGTVPATQAGYLGAISNTLGAGLTGLTDPVPFTVQVLFPVRMNTTPAMTYYNPTSNNAKWYAQGPLSPQDSGVAASLLNLSTVGVGVYNPLAALDAPGNNFYVHAAANAVLGY